MKGGVVIDHKKIALIHIVKKKLGLSDQEYRKILNEAAGVSTSKDLNDQKFRKLMNVFVRSKHYQADNQAITLKQRFYIEHLVENLGWSPNHLKKFLLKYYHQERIIALSKQNASKLIVSLNNLRVR